VENTEGKVCSELNHLSTKPWNYGAMDVQIHSSLRSALVAGEQSAPILGLLNPEKEFKIPTVYETG
jgi:hypothetical protein